MSSSAYVLPYDHQTTGAVIDGIDAAKLWSTTPQGETPSKAGTIRTFYNTPAPKLTIVSSLGDGFATKKAEEKRELVRKSIGSAVKDLKNIEGVKDVAIEASLDPHAAGMLLFILCDPSLNYNK
jgi:aminopeptidase